MLLGFIHTTFPARFAKSSTTLSVVGQKDKRRKASLCLTDREKELATCQFRLTLTLEIFGYLTSGHVCGALR
jgi:hypothetical protein